MINPSGKCMCGCGKPVRRSAQNRPEWGYAEGEFPRFIAGHHAKDGPEDYVVNPESGCWEWRRKARWGGAYGQLRRGGKSLAAHRWYYEQLRGPIPEGLELDHLCRNKLCVNPAHLEPVTRTENVRRGPHTKLDVARATAILAWVGAGWTQAAAAAAYGVSKSTVSELVRGNIWRELAR